MKNFNITNEQIEYLRPYLPNIDDLLKGNICDFQFELDDVIVSTFRNDEPTEISYKLEKIYDEIYGANLENSNAIE